MLAVTVCNAVFYDSMLRRSPAPRMAGFVHVPLVEGVAVTPTQRARAGRRLTVLSRENLLDGAIAILRTCVEGWRNSEASNGVGVASR